MFKKFITALLFFMPVMGATNQGISDPMRPPGQSSIRAVNSGGVAWTLTAILVSPERRLAMINNRLVGIGGKVNGARVKAIHSHAVELDVGGERIMLKPANYPVRRAKK